MTQSTMNAELETPVVRMVARKKAISPITGTSQVVVRVLCVDDHLLLAEGMRVQMSLDPGIDFVGWLPDASKLLEEVARTRPDVVTLDIEMPGPDVFEAADRLHRQFPDVRSHFSAHTYVTVCLPLHIGAVARDISLRARTSSTSWKA